MTALPPTCPPCSASATPSRSREVCGSPRRRAAWPTPSSSPWPWSRCRFAALKGFTPRPWADLPRADGPLALVATAQAGTRTPRAPASANNVPPRSRPVAPTQAHRLAAVIRPPCRRGPRGPDRRARAAHAAQRTRHHRRPAPSPATDTRAVSFLRAPPACRDHYASPVNTGFTNEPDRAGNARPKAAASVV